MTAYGLAAWFDIPITANDPNDDEVRCEILSDCYGFRYWGNHDRKVIIQGKKYRTIIEEDESESSVVWFDAVANDRWFRCRFWMNKTSIKDLGDLLRSSPGSRRPFDELFINVLE